MTIYKRQAEVKPWPYRTLNVDHDTHQLVSMLAIERGESIGATVREAVALFAALQVAEPMRP
jgi:hypothetical protein